jgi:hypothetical protein
MLPQGSPRATFAAAYFARSSTSGAISPEPHAKWHAAAHPMKNGEHRNEQRRHDNRANHHSVIGSSDFEPCLDELEEQITVLAPRLFAA